jgi:hypothetical protein
VIAADCALHYCDIGLLIVHCIIVTSGCRYQYTAAQLRRKFVRAERLLKQLQA